MKKEKQKTKRKLVQAVLLALALLCLSGCEKPSKAEAGGEASPPAAPEVAEEKPRQEEPTPEEIAQAIRESSHFAYGWFWENVHVDHEDTIFRDDIMDGEWPLERVIEEGVTTKADVMALTEAYFTADVVQQLMSSKDWVETDTALYVSATEGLGGAMADSVEIQIHQDNDRQYTIEVTDLFRGEKIEGLSEPYTVHYVKEGGRWVFDQVVLMVGDTSNAVTVVEEVEESSDGEEIGKRFEDTELLSTQLPQTFFFSAGVGAWGTELTIYPDWTFSGNYHDSEMGAVGPGYPGGTVYFCDFTGEFSLVKKVNEKEYILRLKNLHTEKPVGQEEIREDTLYVASDPYGLEDADEFRLYLPGRATNDLPKEFIEWVGMPHTWGDQVPETLPFWGLYNIGGQEGFFGETEEA